MMAEHTKAQLERQVALLESSQRALLMKIDRIQELSKSRLHRLKIAEGRNEKLAKSIARLSREAHGG